MKEPSGRGTAREISTAVDRNAPFSNLRMISGGDSVTLIWLGGVLAGKRMETEPRAFSPDEIGVKRMGGIGDDDGV